jgi:hypothetical protein
VFATPSTGFSDHSRVVERRLQVAAGASRTPTLLHFHDQALELVEATFDGPLATGTLGARDRPIFTGPGFRVDL